MFNLKQWVRPNILSLKPYSSARDEYQGEASIFLDANENPYPMPYNRYPDPMQWEVKQRISALKGIDSKQILLGNGSDEPIDLIYRIFCDPGKDNVIAIAPSYGMYEVCADINNIEYRKVPLEEIGGVRYQLPTEAIMRAVDGHSKVLFLCSPNNPTAIAFPVNAILGLVRDFPGIVVVDEAYIDFSSQPSVSSHLSDYPNLIVLQTLSKAWGSAGIRLGMAFASAEIIALMNKVKYPYNINQLTQNEALRILSDPKKITDWVCEIVEQRNRFAAEVKTLSFVQEVYPSDANFVLVRMTDANAIYNGLLASGIIVRNRHKIEQCADCLRITIGTPAENKGLMNVLQSLDS